MNLLRSEVYRFKGLHGCESKCGLQIYGEEGKPYVIIATELPDNEGTSVTNYVEGLAAQVLSSLLDKSRGFV